MTAEEFNQISAFIEGATGHKFDDVKMEAWFTLLRDLPAEAVKAGTVRCLQECESAWPQPATIRRMAVEWQQGVIDGHDTAWERVIEAVKVFGWIGQKEGMASLDPITRRAVRGIGGWSFICDVDVNNRTAIAAQFRMAYQSVVNEAQRGRVLSEDVKPRRAIESTVKKLVHKLPEVPDA